MAARKSQCGVEKTIRFDFATQGSQYGPAMKGSDTKFPPQTFRCTQEPGHTGDHVDASDPGGETRWET
jgi:hypothetical protein